MAITSENNSTAIRGFRKSQYRYAMTYVVITLVVLLILNIYCSIACQNLFYESKKSSMIEKCLLASDEVSTLEVMNSSTVSAVITDQAGCTLYDSSGAQVGSYALLPEILTALEGNDVCSWKYRSGTIDCRAATPVFYYGTIVGCVYMTDFDTTQGKLIQSLQRTIFFITFLLEAVVLLFSVAFANTYSRRLNRIMASMRIIREGDYSHKVDLGGNDELTILGNEFNELTEKLQNSEQKRSRFVSDASHELKTPLASIKLLTDSILQYDMDLETTREFVGDIGNEAERLNRMTEKLLTLTRSEGTTNQDLEIIYLAPTVRRVARMLKSNAQKAGVAIHLELEQDSTILILEDDLYQIVFNLMENGIKYNQPGGSLTVTLHRQEDNVVLEVTDTGMGIPAEAIDHVFERFYRVDKARSRQTGGSGLGLAIVRGIVHRNRGEITLESEPGKGTTFRVIFPAFDAEVDAE